MNWNRRVRKTHRALSVVFTMAVLANVLLNLLPRADEALVTRVGLLTLLPLGLLMITGLYLFVLPYTAGDDDAPGTDP